MNNHAISEEDRRLAAEMGLDADDPLVRVLRPQAKLATKIELWTETNLELLKLLNTRTKETERLTQNFERLTNIYEALDSRYELLQLQIQELSRSSALARSAPTLNESMVQRLDTSLKTLARPIQKVSDLDLERRDWIWSGKLALNGVTLFCISILAFQVGALSRQDTYIGRLLNSVLIRLERLEQNSGTLPE